MNVDKNQTASQQEIEEASTVVRWSGEERDMLKLWFIDSFNKKKLPFESWIVTIRELMRAQLEVLDENRFRSYLPKADVLEIQSRVDTYIETLRVDGIIKQHRNYVIEHGITPIEHIDLLNEEIAALTTNLSEVTISRDTLLTRITELESKLSRLMQSSLTEQLPTTKPPLALILYAPHTSKMQRDKLEESVRICDSVTWIDDEPAERVQQLVNGKHVFAYKNSSSRLASALRKGETFHEVSGFSGMREAVKSFLQVS